MAKDRQNKQKKPTTHLSRRRRRMLGRSLLRVLAWILAPFLTVAVLAALVYGLRTAFFTANPRFVLRRIQVDASGNVQPTQVIGILKASGVRPHVSNLFALDPAALRRHLEAEVEVDRATVMRRLPDTLEVQIYERRPVAQLKVRPRQLLDADGWILPMRHDDRSRLLPEITGVRNPRSLKVGTQIRDEIARSALRFLMLIATRPDGQLYDIATVQLDYRHPSLIAHIRERDGSTFRRNARIVLPVDGLEFALDTVSTIVRDRNKAGEKTSFIDATYKNIPVKP